MPDTLESKIKLLEEDLAELKKKRKDRWDKFQLLASLLIPASIAIVGFMVSQSLKEAEIVSTQRIASGQETVARINARVGQANLVKSFMEALLSNEPRQRKLAIEAVLIALPEDGPRLVKIVSETDPDQDVRLFAKTQQRVGHLLDAINNLPENKVIDLVNNPPVKDTIVENIIAFRDPKNRRAVDPKVAREMLKMWVVLMNRSDPVLEVWESRLAKMM